MLIKTNQKNQFHRCVQSRVDGANIIGIQLDEQEQVEKIEMFADFGGVEDCYYGDVAKLIYHYFAL